MWNGISVVLLQISLATNNVRYFSLLYCSFDFFVCVCVCVKSLFKCWSIFWGSYYCVLRVLYVFWVHVLCQICVLWTFSFTPCFFAFLFSKWCLFKGFNFSKVQFIILFNSKCFLRNLWLPQGHKDFPLSFYF